MTSPMALFSRSFWQTAPNSWKQDWLIPLLLMGLTLSLYMPNLGSYGLYDPWETHYGEVARHMVESNQYIDPFWGAAWDSEGVKRERSGFYSKPPLTMWMMALGMNLFDADAFGVRFFFPLFMLLALLSIYVALSKCISRQAGLIAYGVVALSPSMSLMNRQAVTDTPLVACIILGMMSLIVALFHKPPEDQSKPSLLLKGSTLAFFCLLVFGQLWIIWPMDRSPDFIRPSPVDSWITSLFWYLNELWMVGRGKGWVISTLMAPVSVWAGWQILKSQSRRQHYFDLFYLCCGATVCAKGWLGWAPMGGALFLYLLLSRQWFWFLKAQPLRGLLIVGLSGHLWVLAMLGGHHPKWMNRFIIHDHINRLFVGVHSTDSGGFEYFIQWIGYGLYPLVIFLPLALIYWIGWKPKTLDFKAQSEKRVIHFILLWSFFGFFLFSKSNTKFHHYIFPVIPALGILIALWIHHLLKGQARLHAMTLICAMGMLAWIGYDVSQKPTSNQQGAHHWINLFTYKYDRKWPVEPKIEEIKKAHSQAMQTAWTTRLQIPLSEDKLIPFSKTYADLIKQKQDAQTRDHLLGKPVRSLTWWYAALLLIWSFILGINQLTQKRESMTLTQSDPDPHFMHPSSLKSSSVSTISPWIAKLNYLGFSGLGICSLLLSIYCIHTYLPTVAPHWSQWDMWDEYYQSCTPFKAEEQEQFEAHLLQISERIPQDLSRFPRTWCKEPFVAFRMNWRGENFYSGNTMIPILYTKDFKPFLKKWGVDQHLKKDRTFYVFTERKRLKSEFIPSLPKHLKNRYKEVFGKGRKFVLLKVDPTP